MIGFKKPSARPIQLGIEIRERVERDIERASSYDLMLAMQCFRRTSNKKIFGKCKPFLI